MPGYMGRRAEPGLKEVGGRRVNPKLPLDDPADGCPGAWVRCRFIDSLHDFLRARTEHGGRVPNPFLDACEDELVWQLVLYAEGEQERHWARLHEA